MKAMADEQGLNNPRSKKNIAPKVLDHGLTAFGDMYHDYNKTPRFFMMMFGNVSDSSLPKWVIVLYTESRTKNRTGSGS
jgi:hypothetical protein